MSVSSSRARMVMMPHNAVDIYGISLHASHLLGDITLAGYKTVLQLNPLVAPAEVTRGTEDEENA